MVDLLGEKLQFLEGKTSWLFAAVFMLLLQTLAQESVYTATSTK
jgi:hypothetical protein